MNESLSPEAVRVLGVLIEKELSTPEYYPMTLNGLVVGCNQKSSRDPVVEYGESMVVEALDELVRARLAGHASVAGSRVEKFRHAARQALGLDSPQLAVLASLMLRGPETIGELKTRTSRMFAFDDLEAVQAVLDSLAGRGGIEAPELDEGLPTRGEPLVTHLGGDSGRKGVRWAHLLSGTPSEDAQEAGGAGISSTGPVGEGAVVAQSKMREELESLRSRLDELESEFERFRSQFE